MNIQVRLNNSSEAGNSLVSRIRDEEPQLYSECFAPTDAREQSRAMVPVDGDQANS